MNSLRPKEMLILAGGLGSRLRAVVSDVPKPMAPIGGRPFLEYLLDYWITQGVQRFVLSTGYLGHSIQDHFGGTYRSATIAYVHEHAPLGTGGALRLALTEHSWSGKFLVMINGDTWFPVDLGLMVTHALRQEKPVTIALRAIDENDRYGGVRLGPDGVVEAFDVKSQGRTLINAGCYLLDVATMRAELKEYPAAFSLEKDFMVPYVSRGRVGSSIQDRPFLDIGVPEDYRRAAAYLS